MGPIDGEIGAGTALSVTCHGALDGGPGGDAVEALLAGRAAPETEPFQGRWRHG
jgi:hypothetical protein